MKNDAFAAFGEAAEKGIMPIMASGRLPHHESALDATVADVVAKLRPKSGDRLLEIGCGLGLLLRPLAARVREAVGIDHPSVIAQFSAQNPPQNVTLLGGRFPEVSPEGTFDCVLVFSVLHYMENAEDGTSFINRCVQLLAPGGTLLVADLPNSDVLRRHLASNEGRRSRDAIAAARASAKAQDPESFAVWERFIASRFIDDDYLLSTLANLRRAGFESYLVPQDPSLPNPSTREDLVVRRRA